MKQLNMHEVGLNMHEVGRGFYRLYLLLQLRLSVHSSSRGTTCLPRKHGDIPLSAFPEDTKSSLSAFIRNHCFCAEHHQYRIVHLAHV